MNMNMNMNMNIAVAGTGYVGLSLAVLSARRNQVLVVDVVSEKAEAINEGRSPIADAEVEAVLAGGGLGLAATLNGAATCANTEAGGTAWLSRPSPWRPVANRLEMRCKRSETCYLRILR